MAQAINPNIISRDDARALGQKWYFTGKLCQNGHIDKRYVSTTICYACKREQNDRDYKNHTGRVSQTNKRSYSKNRQARYASSARWVKNNLEKVRQIKRKNKKKHREKYRIAEKLRAREKRRRDPLHRLHKNMSKAIWQWLKGAKNFRSWLELVDFDIEVLKKHLEAKFRDGMSWKNYGQYWHVDHIKPLSMCSTFEEAWALTNLQPLLTSENLQKNNRWQGKIHRKRKYDIPII